MLVAPGNRPGAPMDSSGSRVPTATTWPETVTESHANGSAAQLGGQTSQFR